MYMYFNAPEGQKIPDTKTTLTCLSNQAHWTVRHTTQDNCPLKLYLRFISVPL